MTGVRRYMLDTNVILGIILGDKEFSNTVKNIIDFNYGVKFVSVEVLKELSYLKQSGRPDIKMSFKQFVDFLKVEGLKLHHLTNTQHKNTMNCHCLKIIKTLSTGL
jgi:PIN domain nuclease of toxin-antitoxin system